MDHYIDIQIQPDDEMRENVLLNKVYSKLHKALFTLNAQDIGVSFPEYRVKLGRTLRIHSSAPRLTELQQLNWLGGLSGYCKSTAIQPIPAHVMYRTLSRIQATMTQAKLNRLIKRGTIPEDCVKLYKAKMFSQGLDNPYLELESTSNGHKHRRCLVFGEPCEIPSLGEFDYFGLSKTATIPCF